MRRRLPIAVLVATVGTVVFLVLRAVLFGLLEPFEYVVGCFLGAFVATLVFVPSRPIEVLSALARAVPIVMVTYLVIAGGHLLHSLDHWDYTKFDEAKGLLFWAVVTTGWWLPLGTAATIVVGAKLLYGPRGTFQEQCDAVDRWKNAESNSPKNDGNTASC